MARRLDKLEINQNSYADISDYVASLQQSGKLRKYPAGLVEAAYTIAAGNFGWLNVIMAHCDQYLEKHPDKETGEILQDLAYSVPRFKESLIDHSQLDYINTKPAHIPFVKKRYYVNCRIRKIIIVRKNNKFYYQRNILKAYHYLKSLSLCRLRKMI